MLPINNFYCANFIIFRASSWRRLGFLRPNNAFRPVKCGNARLNYDNFSFSCVSNSARKSRRVDWGRQKYIWILIISIIKASSWSARLLLLVVGSPTHCQFLKLRKSSYHPRKPFFAPEIAHNKLFDPFGPARGVAEALITLPPTDM